MHPLLRPLLALPAHVLNGIVVSLGVTLAYLAVHPLGGAVGALSASSGAVYASLADQPNALGRTWRRVLLAGVIGILVSLVVAALREDAIALAAVVVGIGFLSGLSQAWGPRVGALSFVGTMAFVFTYAAHPAQDTPELLTRIAWVAAGSALYLAWATVLCALLQPRYRTLALGSVITAIANLLRARAAVLRAPAQHADAGTRLQSFLAQETQLDDRLQVARDILFAASDSDRARLQSGLLLRAIELRDGLLLSQLDLDLLGSDDAGVQAWRALATSYLAMADQLDALHRGVVRGLPVDDDSDARAALRNLDPVALFGGDGRRRRLLASVVDRSGHMIDDVRRMQVLHRQEDKPRHFARSELRLFVTVEGWPLAALRPHFHLGSPVLRHALRSGAALGAAYAVGVWLPWAAHPHWMVLSVAVVLRGTLDQTLTRRNLRVAGTAAGCGIVLGLSFVATPWLSTAVFLAATGLAHAFALSAYFVTATAATVMALLQAHLVNPDHGFAVFERLADTLIGAAIAWAACYLLPSWERKGLPNMLKRLLQALDELAGQAVRLPDQTGSELAVRMARRTVYESLGSLAGAAQRSRAEPRTARVPTEAYGAVLAHSHALMSHLASVRVLLARRRERLDPQQTEQVLAHAVELIRKRLLEGPSVTLPALTEGQSAALIAEREVPETSPAEALLPWLQRRLSLAADSAASLAAAAGDLERAAR